MNRRRLKPKQSRRSWKRRKYSDDIFTEDPQFVFSEKPGTRQKEIPESDEPDDTDYVDTVEPEEGIDSTPDPRNRNELGY